MGKKRLERIEPLKNPNHRRVTYCKRKKGLLKKSIELSLLCDLKIFVLIYDKKKKKCVHFASDPKEQLVNMFNEHCQREFLSNKDYGKVGGRPEDICVSLDSDDELSNSLHSATAIHKPSKNLVKNQKCREDNSSSNLRQGPEKF